MCRDSSSFVYLADFLMRGFWRRMTEYAACSLGKEGHLKEMGITLSTGAPNARSPPLRCPAGSLAAPFRLRRVALACNSHYVRYSENL